MLKMNKSTRFALYCIVELSRDADAVLSARHIADKYCISEHHVVKVLQQLTRAGLVRSIRGTKGGFQIAVDPKTVTMYDVVKITEPIVPKRGCSLLELDEECSFDNICRIGDVFAEIQEQAYYTLKSVTIATLIEPKKIT